MGQLEVWLGWLVSEVESSGHFDRNIIIHLLMLSSRLGIPALYSASPMLNTN